MASSLYLTIMRLKNKISPNLLEYFPKIFFYFSNKVWTSFLASLKHSRAIHIRYPPTYPPQTPIFLSTRFQFDTYSL